jgi:hypothetical protein
VQIPPKLVVRRYLREQLGKMERLNLQDLSGARQDYYYAFEDLAERFGPHALYVPRADHERPPTFMIEESLLQRAGRVQALLDSGWLKMEAKTYLCGIRDNEG